MKKIKHSMSLIIIMTLMVIMVSALNYSDKEKLKVEVIKGENSVLKDVSLIYAPGNSVLSNTEIELSVNGLDIKSKLKKSIERDYVDIDRTHESFTKYDDKSIYQNDKKIGKIEFFTDFANDSQGFIQIYEKDKITDKVNKINIKLEKDLFKNSYLNIVFNQIIDEDIYTVVVETDNTGYTGNLHVIKINTINKEHEIIKSFKFISSDRQAYLKEIMFYYNNKIYIEVYNYNEEKEYTNFIIYDIKNNTIKRSNQFTDEIKNQNEFDYTIQDNKFKLLIGDKKGNLSTLIYEINDNDLKLIENKKHSLNIGYTSSDINQQQVKVKLIDNKIYSLVTSKSKLRGTLKNDVNLYINGIKPTEFTVFDIEKEEVIYKANLSNGDKCMEQKMYFVKSFS